MIVEGFVDSLDLEYHSPVDIYPTLEQLLEAKPCLQNRVDGRFSKYECKPLKVRIEVVEEIVLPE